MFAATNIHVQKAVFWIFCALYFRVPVFYVSAFSGLGETGEFLVYILLIVDVFFTYYTVASFSRRLIREKPLKSAPPVTKILFTLCNLCKILIKSTEYILLLFEIFIRKSNLLPLLPQSFK